MRNTGRRRATTVAAAVLAGVTALVLSACAPTYTYLTSSKAESYLAVPHSWKVFNQQSIMSSTGSSGSGTFTYLAFFDDNKRPSLKDSLAATPKPWGVIRIRELSSSEQESYSFDSLGNELIQLDQMTQSGQAQVVGNTTVLTHGGYRGIRQELAIDVGGKTLLADEEGYVNSETTEAWALLVGCSASCFNQNKGAINRIVSSWTVGKS